MLDVLRVNKVDKTLKSIQKYFLYTGLWHSNLTSEVFSQFQQSFFCVFSYLCLDNSYSNNNMVTLDGDKLDSFTMLRWSVSVLANMFQLEKIPCLWQLFA